MPPQALGLVLVAALLHAAWNIAAKHGGGGAPMALASALLVSLLWAPLAWWADAASVLDWGWREWALVSASAAIHVAYFLTLLAGYRRADLTVVYPVARGTAPLVTATVAVAVLGEPLNAAVAAGIGAVAVGVFLLAGGARRRAAVDARARRRARIGAAWGAATGVLIAVYSVVDGVAVRHLLLSPILVDYVGNVLRVPLLAALCWRERAGLRAEVMRHWRVALVVATLGPAAYMLVLYALTMAPLSRVAPAREVSMLIAALVGGRLLAEPDRGPRLAGAACVVAGVAALAWA